VRIALVGPLSPALIEAPGATPKPLESDRTHLLKRGQLLRIGMVEGSSTAHLAVAGGFALPPFMGSLSTYARAGVGGLDGRKLAQGDVLPLTRERAPDADESSASL
jgi:allophanate hydrolase subunit 2